MGKSKSLEKAVFITDPKRPEGIIKIGDSLCRKNPEIHTLCLAAWKIVKALRDGSPIPSDKELGIDVSKNIQAAEPSKCFIATAACGQDSREVAQLQVFREHVLRPSSAGRALIRVYEQLSPPLADFIHHRPFAKSLVRILVVKPASVIARRLITRI